MKALALVDALVVSEIPQLVFVRESESHTRGGEFAIPKGVKGEKSPWRENEQRRNTPNFGSMGFCENSPARIWRIASLLQTPFLVFDSKYGF